MIGLISSPGLKGSKCCCISYLGSKKCYFASGLYQNRGAMPYISGLKEMLFCIRAISKQRSRLQILLEFRKQVKMKINPIHIINTDLCARWGFYYPTLKIVGMSNGLIRQLAIGNSYFIRRFLRLS